MAYLSIDVGSSTVKAALIREDGSLLALARRAVELLHGPGPNEHEVEASSWIEAAFSAIREVCSSREPPRALAVSGNGPTLLALDKDDEPLGRALSWMDRRASAEAALVSRLAGLPVDASFYLPKALWLFHKRQGLAERLGRFFSCPEYLLYVLTGEAFTYLPAPGYLPYIWSPELIAKVGLPEAAFPPFIKPGSPAGRLRPAQAAALGLPAGIPAAAGFPDFLAGLVGAGVVSPGLAGDRGGTSEALNLCAIKPYPGRGLLSLPHAIEGLWNLSGGISTAGKALEWLATSLAFPSADALVEEASRAPAGSRGALFLPYLAGERAPLWDPDRRGAFLGLSLSQSRPELARAACESLGFGLRLPAELAREGGFEILTLRSSGSPARSPFLAALKASVLGLPVEIPALTDTELAGDACAAALCLGEAASIAEAAGRMVKIAARFEPEPRLRSRYDEGYGLWKEGLGALAHVDSRAAALRAAFSEDGEGTGEDHRT